MKNTNKIKAKPSIGAVLRTAGIIAFFAIIGFSMLACDQIPSTEIDPENPVKVTINLPQPSGARSLTENDLIAQTANYHLVIERVVTGGSNVPVHNQTHSANQQSISLAFHTPGTHQFTLTALNAANAALGSGTVTQNLTVGTNNVIINLIPAPVFNDPVDVMVMFDMVNNAWRYQVIIEEKLGEGTTGGYKPVYNFTTEDMPGWSPPSLIYTVERNVTYRFTGRALARSFVDGGGGAVLAEQIIEQSMTHDNNMVFFTFPEDPGPADVNVSISVQWQLP